MRSSSGIGGGESTKSSIAVILLMKSCHGFTKIRIVHVWRSVFVFAVCLDIMSRSFHIQNTVVAGRCPSLWSAYPHSTVKATSVPSWFVLLLFCFF